jgi:8-oxo-dGTP diphosphatase
MAEDKQFFVGQKAFIRKGDKVLVLFDPVFGLDFPGGKIQTIDADILAALKREVKEETGLDVKIGDPFTTWTWKVPEGAHRNAGKEIYLIGFRCEYISGEVRLSDEHNSYRWVSEKTYREIDDKSDFFHALEKYFLLSAPAKSL